ncbi:hypothetical protein ILUMI_00039 [Ignelater luminosus]|uniref:Tc1-like transposase DDE domain-containing protein n=1 Tax=Ignelater luminosus TaxID=2038154 RepID=A0A8K0GIT4_IGNLU|nr:hypothetical protein ILUMI_00039 [Ignelater luminosus]
MIREECFLRSGIISFNLLIGEEFVFMQDSTRPLTAKFIVNYLNEARICCMNWPQKSTDINLIEHVWNLLKKRIPVLENLKELEKQDESRDIGNGR